MEQAVRGFEPRLGICWYQGVCHVTNQISNACSC